MAEVITRTSDPKEVKNWKVHLYCIGVCFGAVALGMTSTQRLCYTYLTDTGYDVSVMGV